MSGMRNFSPLSVYGLPAITTMIFLPRRSYVRDRSENVFGMASGQAGGCPIGSGGVLDEAGFKRVRVTADHVAQVVCIGAVREHVGDAEFLAAFRVRIARHHDDDLLATQVVRPRSQ